MINVHGGPWYARLDDPARWLITVTGDRQTGKTQFLLEQMVRHAQEGMQVSYSAHTMRMAMDVFHRLEQLAPAGLTKLRRQHGCEAAEFSSGGRISFRAATHSSFRGVLLDVVALDEVDNSILDEARPAVCASALGVVYHVPS